MKKSFSVCLLTFVCLCLPARAQFEHGQPHFTCDNSNGGPITNYIGTFYKGVDLAVQIPPGGYAHIYVDRRRAEASWVETCINTLVEGNYDQHNYMSSVVSRGTIQAPHQDFGVLPPPSPPVSSVRWLAVVSDRMDGGDHEGWVGVSPRQQMQGGLHFDWYDSAGPGNPDTVVYVCLYSSSRQNKSDVLHHLLNKKVLGQLRNGSCPNN